MRITVSSLTSHLAEIANSFGKDEQRSFWHLAGGTQCPVLRRPCACWVYSGDTRIFPVCAVVGEFSRPRLPLCFAVAMCGCSIWLFSFTPSFCQIAVSWSFSFLSVLTPLAAFGMPVLAFRRYADFTTQHLPEVNASAAFERIRAVTFGTSCRMMNSLLNRTCCSVTEHQDSPVVMLNFAGVVTLLLERVLVGFGPFNGFDCYTFFYKYTTFFICLCKTDKLNSKMLWVVARALLCSC